MATRYPRIGTGKPGSIANKIYRHQKISQTRSASQTRHQHRDKTKTKKRSRSSSDRSELTDEMSDIETNSGIFRNFNNLDRFHAEQNNRDHRDRRRDYQGNNRENFKPSTKPNHYVPFDPRDTPTPTPRHRERRDSQAWSDSSNYEASNYNSDPATAIVSNPRVPRNMVTDRYGQGKDGDSAKSDLTLWTIVIVVSIIILILIIVGIIYYLSVGAPGLSSRLTEGPGDNSPCSQYEELSDVWRLIGRRPFQAGVGYNCDSSLKPGWFRFVGEAGTVLADSREPPGWESCGTSRVVWLEGEHPSMDQGTVEVSLCVSGLSSSCTVKVSGAVRLCRGDGGDYYVYRLVPIPGPCQWGYCAMTSHNLPPT